MLPLFPYPIYSEIVDQNHNEESSPNSIFLAKINVFLFQFSFVVAWLAEPVARSCRLMTILES
jgi:hypothetical protein